MAENASFDIQIEFDPSASSPGSYSGNVVAVYQAQAYGNQTVKETITVECTGTSYSTEVLDPLYKVTSIVYNAPGNMSQDGFTDTTTDGTTTTIGSSFMFGTMLTFTEGFGDCSVGCVTASEGFGVSSTSSSSNAFEETFSDATGVANANQGTNPDAINHDLDLFLIWMNPQVTVQGVPPTPSLYSIGVQPTANGQTPLPDIIPIFAYWMEANPAGVTTVPATWLNEQLNPETGQYTPGLAAVCKNIKTSEYNAHTCTLADQCGCVAADFAPILQQDPLLYANGITKPLSPYANTASPLLADTSGETACAVLPVSSSNKCRYVPVPSAPGSTVGATATLAYSVNDTFQQGENQSTTVTEGEQTQETTTVSVMGGNTEFSLTTTDTWQWTQSESVGTENGKGVTLSVMLESGTSSCGQTIPIYEDTVYHTFVFQQPGGTAGASCTTATATPTFSPAAGTYSSAQTVTISAKTANATIYYTTNGTTPTTSSTLYKAPITVSATETVKAIAYFPGWTTGTAGSAAYTIK